MRVGVVKANAEITRADDKTGGEIAIDLDPALTAFGRIDVALGANATTDPFVRAASVADCEEKK